MKSLYSSILLTWHMQERHLPCTILGKTCSGHSTHPTSKHKSQCQLHSLGNRTTWHHKGQLMFSSHLGKFCPKPPDVLFRLCCRSANLHFCWWGIWDQGVLAPWLQKPPVPYSQPAICVKWKHALHCWTSKHKIILCSFSPESHC